MAEGLGRPDRVNQAGCRRIGGGPLETAKRLQVPPPAWFNDPPEKWPPGVKRLFSILAEVAERRLADEAQSAKAGAA